jgi:hypothetical protein
MREFEEDIYDLDMRGGGIGEDLEGGGFNEYLMDETVTVERIV